MGHVKFYFPTSQPHTRGAIGTTIPPSISPPGRATHKGPSQRGYSHQARRRYSELRNIQCTSVEKSGPTSDSVRLQQAVTKGTIAKGAIPKGIFAPGEKAGKYRADGNSSRFSDCPQIQMPPNHMRLPFPALACGYGPCCGSRAAFGLSTKPFFAFAMGVDRFCAQYNIRRLRRVKKKSHFKNRTM